MDECIRLIPQKVTENKEGYGHTYTFPKPGYNKPFPVTKDQGRRRRKYNGRQEAHHIDDYDEVDGGQDGPRTVTLEGFRDELHIMAKDDAVHGGIEARI